MAKPNIEFFTADTIPQVIALLEREGGDTGPILTSTYDPLTSKDGHPIVLGRLNERGGYGVRECDRQLKKRLKEYGATCVKYLIKVVRNSKNDAELTQKLLH